MIPAGDGPLLPARIRRALGTGRFGRRVYYFPETESTNTAAARLARAGEDEGTLVVSDRQTRGRGRLDHEWWSAEGRDLLFTVILRPGLSAGALLPVTLVFAAAAAATLSERLCVDVAVKWPNDVLAGGGKIAGVLAEASSGTGQPAFVVVGTGVNVNSVPDDFPRALRGLVSTCRQATGREWDRAALLASLLAAMEARYDHFLREGFAGLRRDYEELLAASGRRVSFERDGRRVTATVEGVGDDGGLRVRTLPGGADLVLYSEEVTVET